MTQALTVNGEHFITLTHLNVYPSLENKNFAFECKWEEAPMQRAPLSTTCVIALRVLSPLKTTPTADKGRALYVTKSKKLWKP